MSENNRNYNPEQTSERASAPSPSSSSDLSAQIQKIATHLGFLEKKLDLLLAQQPQSRGGNFGGGGGHREGGFRPSRPPFRGGGGGGFKRHDRGGEGGFKRREHGNSSGGGNFAPRENRGEGRPPFKKRRPSF